MRRFGCVGLISVTLGFGCRAAPEERPHPAANPGAVAPGAGALAATVARSTGPVLASPLASSPRAAASGSAVASSEAEQARGVVLAWSAALDRHDLGLLGALYAERVHFYGRSLAKAEVLEQKRRALSRAPDFRQQIVGQVQIEARPGGARASFTKRSGRAGALAEVRARLDLVQHAGALLIAEESDEASESRAPDAGAASCMETASRLIEELPEVRRERQALAREADRSDGGVQLGGIGPIDGPDGGFIAELGLHSAERFEARVSYSVDALGHAELEVSGEPITLPRAVAQAISAACAR